MRHYVTRAIIDRNQRRRLIRMELGEYTELQLEARMRAWSSYYRNGFGFDPQAANARARGIGVGERENSNYDDILELADWHRDRLLREVT